MDEIGGIVEVPCFLSLLTLPPFSLSLPLLLVLPKLAAILSKGRPSSLPLVEDE